MKYQVLARKWRPHNFSEVVGQEHVVKSLSNALHHDRLHHAYLFTGTRGVGKTTLARILAKAINCENRQDFNPCGVCPICVALDEGRFMDLIEVDAASRTKVEDTRDLLDNAQYAPNQGRYKVYLIDEVHMLSSHSFNALLKTLEEPPAHVKFLLATTDPQKIPVTVLSRCLQLNLKQLLPSQIFTQMAHILGQEGIAFEDAALKTLSRAADGSMRDGLSLLDQAIVYSNSNIRVEDIIAMLGTVAQQPVEQLLGALADNNAAAIFASIDEIANLTPDFSHIVQQILQVFQRIALLQHYPAAVTDDFDADMLADLAARISREDVQLFYQIALLGQRDLELAPDPRSGFEMLMLRMLTFRPANVAMPDSIQPPAKPKPQQAPSLAPTPAKPAPAAIQEPPPAAQPASVNNTNGELNWADMITAMRLESLTKQLANNCVLEQLDDLVCKLSLDAAHQHLLSAMRVEKLQKALQAYRGTPLKLHINTVTAIADTPAIQQEIQRENQQQAAVDSINADPQIHAIINQFDARILPGSIEPN